MLNKPLNKAPRNKELPSPSIALRDKKFAKKFASLAILNKKASVTLFRSMFA